MAKIKKFTIEDKNKKRENQAKKKKDIAAKRSNTLKLLIPVLLGGIAITILVLLGLNRYNLKFYIDEEGYVIPKSLSINNIDVDAKESNSLYKFNNGEGIFSLKDKKNEYFIGDSKVNVDSNFPAYTRNGQVLYFLDNNSQIISNEFDYIDTYAGLRLSDGITFNSDDSRADLDEIILAEVGYGYQLAQGTKINNESNSKSIPMNTIVNFSNDRIDCYEFSDGVLKSYNLTVGENNTITIGDNEYNYKEFLQNLGIWKEASNTIAREKVEEPEKVVPKKVKTKSASAAAQTPSDVFEQPQASAPSQPTTRPPREKPAPEREAYEKPEVTVNPDGATSWVYSVTVPISVYDPYNRIIKGGAQIFVYEIDVERDSDGKMIYYDEDGNVTTREDGGKPKMASGGVSAAPFIRTPLASRNNHDFYDTVLSQLKPDSYYHVTYSFQYADEYNYKHYVGDDIGDFYTLDYDALGDIALDINDSDVEVYDTYFEVKDLVFTNISNGQKTTPGSAVVNAYKDFSTTCAEYFITKITVKFAEDPTGTKDYNTIYSAGSGSSQTKDFNSSEIGLMRKGFTMEKWNSLNTLKSGTNYSYIIILSDKFGHEFTYSGSAFDNGGVHHARTCKKQPTVDIAVPSKTNTPISVGINVTWNNTGECIVKGDGPRLYITQEGNQLIRDNGLLLTGYYLNASGQKVEFTNQQYVPILYDANGRVTKIVVTNLPTQTSFDTYVMADFDDNSLPSPQYKADVVLKDTFNFKSGSLTSYGLIRYSGYTDNIANNRATIHPRLDYNNKDSIFEFELLKHVNKIKINISKQSDSNSSIQNITLEKDKLTPLTINATGIEADSNGIYNLPAIDVPATILVNGEEKETTIKISAHYKDAMPKYVGVDTALGNDATNVWEYILATSNSSKDAYFDIVLDQYVTVDDQPVKLVELEGQTSYRAVLSFFGRLEGSSAAAEEDVTSYSSNPISFTTRKTAAVVAWGDFFISDTFIEIYDLEFKDSDHCILECNNGTGFNSKIVVKNYLDGSIVKTVYVDSYSENPSPIRIDGLQNETDYTLEVVCNEYNDMEYASEYPLQLEDAGWATVEHFNYNKIYDFHTRGYISGNIDLESLYRNYATGPEGFETSKYIGVIKNEIVTDENFKVDIDAEGFDVNTDLAETIEDSGWKYDKTSNTYKSSVTKIESDTAYSLFTSAKTTNDVYLPEYLKQLDYIETSGLQYVKTGYFHNKNTEISYEFQPMMNNAQSAANDMFGSRTSTTNADCFNFGFSTAGADNGFYVNLGPFGRLAGSDNEDHYLNIEDWYNYITFDISSKGIIYNTKEIYPLFTDDQIYTNNAAIGQATIEDYLFATNEANVAKYFASVRLKSFTISEQGLTVMNLVPVITTQDLDGSKTNTGKKIIAGTACLYDTVSGKIFINSGSGEFGYSSAVNNIPTLTETYNGKLKQVSYIQSDGQYTYIDTGYYHNNETVIDAIFLPLKDDSAVWNSLYGSRISTKSVDCWDFGFNNPTNYFFVNTSVANLDYIAFQRDIENYSTVHFTNTTFMLNGKSYSTGVQKIGDAYKTDYLFATHQQDSAIDSGWYKLKYFKISEKGEAKREFIPAVTTQAIEVSDGLLVSQGGTPTAMALNAGVAGLYDIANGVFYINASASGEFTYPGAAGADSDIESQLQLHGVRPVQYLRSNGGQYIDTGLVSKYGYNTKVKFAPYNSGAQWQHIVGSHDNNDQATNTKDGSKGWHHSMLRLNYANLRASYANADRFNVNINNGTIYEAEMSIFDAYSDYNSRTINPILDGDITKAGYLKVNGQEVWNAATDSSVNLNQNNSSKSLNTKIGVFAGIYPNNPTNAFNWSYVAIYDLEITVPKGMNSYTAEKEVHHYIPAIAMEDIPAEKVSYKGSKGTTGAIAGTLGLFDLYDNTFYINSGNGAFRYGDFDSEGSVEDIDSGVYTITLYKKEQYTREADPEHGIEATDELRLIELDHVRSDLAANGNIFNVKASDYGLEDGTPIYVQVKVESPSDDFRIGDIYLEEFDDRYDIENKVNLIENFGDDNAPILIDYSYDENGSRMDNRGYAVSTEFTSIRPDSVYYLKGTNLYQNGDYDYTTREGDTRTLANLGDDKKSSNLLVSFYNTNKEFISSQYIGSQGALFKSPAGASYARFTLRGSIKVAQEDPIDVPLAQTIDIDSNYINGLTATNGFNDENYIEKTYDGITYRLKPVEYIQSDGKHWIDTDYSPTRHTKWEFEYQFINSTTAQVGLGYSGEAEPFFLMYLNGGKACFGLGKTATAYNIVVGNYRHTYEVNAHELKGVIDGNRVCTFTEAQYGPEDVLETNNKATITFFARESRVNHYQYAHAAKLYSSKIWEYEGSGYVLKRNYIPVERTRLDADGNEVPSSVTYGLYDSCTEQFLMSRTEQNFLTPTDANGNTIVKTANFKTEVSETGATEIYDEVEYIEANGGQAIDTGFVVTPTSTVNMVFEPQHYSTNSTPQALAGAYWSSNSMLMDIQSGYFQQHGAAMYGDCVLGAVNTTENPYLLPLANRKFTITYGSRDTSQETDITYIDEEGTLREFGRDWRFERYGGGNHGNFTTPATLSTLKPAVVSYWNDRYLNSRLDLTNYYDGKASTWLYFEEDTPLQIQFFGDDRGSLYVRYADGTTANGSQSTEANPYGEPAVRATYPNWSSPVTLNFKKGWNEVLVIYHENSGGDYFGISPKLNTKTQITRRSADYPKLHEVNKDLQVVGFGQPAGDGQIIPEVITTSSSIKPSNESLSESNRGNLFLLGLDMNSLGLSTYDDANPSKYYAYGKLYSATVDIDSTHRIVFTPVRRRSDGMTGLWGVYQTRLEGEANLPSWAGTWTNDAEKGERFFPRANTLTTLNGGRKIQKTEYYQELNYIEAVGNQYLYSGVFPSENITVELEFTPTLSTGTACITGSGWNSNAFMLDYQSSKYYIHGASNVIGTQVANVKHKFVYSTTKVSVDGAERVNTDTLANTGNRQAVHILGYGANSYNARGKLYYIKFYDSGTLIRDMVPVKRTSDGKIGLWDKVTERFYPNEGSGSFVASKAKGEDDVDIDVPIHISSNGIKYTRNNKDLYDGYIVFQPEYSGTYRFYSKDIVSGDPFIYVYETKEDGTFPSFNERNSVASYHDDDGGGSNNFSLDVDLTSGKKYAIVCTTSNLMLKGEFEYDLVVSDSVLDYDFSNAELYLYDASDLEKFTATFSAEVTQNTEIEGGEGQLKDGEIFVRLYRTQEEVDNSVNLDDYKDWIDFEQYGSSGESNSLIYHLPKTDEATDVLSGTQAKFEMPDPTNPEDQLEQSVPANYGYKAALYVKRAGKDSEILLDSVTFVATQPVYVIKDIPTLKAVAADMSGYYICTHDIPNKDVDSEGNYTADGENVVDFTVSNDMFTGVIDWQGHSVSLSSTKPLFDKLGRDALIKNGNINYEGQGSVANDIKFVEDLDGIENEKFIELEYIESNGSQYLVTDVKQSQTTNYEIKFQRMSHSTTDQTIIGNYHSAARMMLIRLEKEGTDAHAALTNDKRYYIKNVDINSPCVYILNQSEFSVNDGTQHSISITRDSYGADTNIQIFREGGTNKYNAYGRLYYVKITNGSTLVFDGVPCIATQDMTTGTKVHDLTDQFVPAGTTGIYDRVSKRFYTSYYSFDYPKLNYSNDTTEAMNWLSYMLPDNETEGDQILDNKAPLLYLPRYYQTTNGVAYSAATKDESRVRQISSDGKTLQDVSDEASVYYLPSKYARLQYLQSDGYAQIDTNYVYQGGTIYTDYEFIDEVADTVSHFVMGAASSSSANGYQATNFKIYNKYIVTYNLGSVFEDKGTLAKGRHKGWLWNEDNNKYVQIANTDNTSSKKIYYASTNAGRYAVNKNLTLFAEGGGGFNRVRIYQFYMMDQNGVLVRNYIPAMALVNISEHESSTGKEIPAGSLGMYDTVSGQFFPNVSTNPSSQFSAPVAYVDYASTTTELDSETACIAKDNYGTISNMILHFHPDSGSAYSVGNYSAGYAYNNYGTIDRFALQYDDGNVNVDNNVAGIAVHNYGSITNGYVSGKSYVNDNGDNDYYGMIHKYNVISRIRAIKVRDNNNSSIIRTKYTTEYSGNNTNAGYLGYITSYNHNRATIDNVYVADNLKIQSLEASSGEFGPWATGSDYLDNDVIAVEYVEANGKQFIETGYMPNSRTEIDFTWSPTALNGSQAIVGTTWAAHTFGLWADTGFWHAGYNKKTNVLQEIGRKYDVSYNVFADQLSINNQEAFDWRVEFYGSLGSRAVNMSDFQGTPNQAIRYYNDTDLSTAMGIGDNYRAKATTWMYTKEAFTLNVEIFTDDQGCVEFNGTQVTQINSCEYKKINLNFVQGWNKLVVCYREGGGGDGWRVRLGNDTSKTLHDEPRIIERRCFDPTLDKDTVHRETSSLKPNTGTTVEGVYVPPDYDGHYRTDKLTNLSTTIKIFGLDSAKNNAYGRMYGLKIYEKDFMTGERTLIHDYVPAVVTNDINNASTQYGVWSASGGGVARGTPGFYDKVASVDENGNKVYDSYGNEIHYFYPSFSTTRLICETAFDDTALNTDYSALITGYNEGSVSNSFTAGDILDVEYGISEADNAYKVLDSKVMSRIGPALGACIESYDNKNVNYVSLQDENYKNDAIDTVTYSHPYNQRSESASLYDVAWYKGIIGEDGDVYDIRSAIDSRYFPRVLFSDSLSASLIPNAELPAGAGDVRIIGSQTRYQGKDENKNQVALVTLFVRNLSKKKITGFEIVDSDGQMLNNTLVASNYYEGLYRYDVLVTYKDSTDNLVKAESSYLVSSYYTGTTNPTPFAFDSITDENYIDVEFYHSIGSVSKWKSLLGGIDHPIITENYRLTNDINFADSTDYHDWVVFADFRGKLDGGKYNSEKVAMDDYLGNLIGREVYIDTDMTGMYTISGVGNVDKAGNYSATRGMGELNPGRIAYYDINSVRDCLFASVSGSVSNIIFDNFRTEYFDDEESANSINDVTTAITGVIAKSNSGSMLDNLHVRNSEFNTRGYGGSLVGYASNTVIRNCSARNTTVTGRTIVQNFTPAYIGGLVGYGYNVKFDNDFVSDINVNANSAVHIVGAGGIAGVVESSNFFACYAVNGLVTSDGDCTGGIVGKVGENSNTVLNEYKHDTSIESCYTTVTVQSTGDFVGGLAGYMGIYHGTNDEVGTNKIFNSYTASTVISTSYRSTNINRINSFSYEDKRYYFNNYAFENQVMNYKNNDATSTMDSYQFGPTTALNGSTRLLDTESLKEPSTWSGEIMLDSNAYEFEESVGAGYMPKLYNSTIGGLVFDQPDELLSNDLVSSLKILGVTNNNSGEYLEVTFALYNTGWDQELYRSYANNDMGSWYDLADWESLTCVGARTTRARGDVEDKFLPIDPYITSDGGLIFKSQFHYGDEEVGHYSDAYLVSLPVYLNEPYNNPRIMGSAYALIALDEDSIAVKNIHTAEEWNKFFSYDGSHYNSAENIRLFPNVASQSVDGVRGDYNFSAVGQHPVAFNAAIRKIYVGYGVNANEENAKVVFTGNINYGNSTIDSSVKELSFISNVSEYFSGIEFNNFHIDYGNRAGSTVQGIIGELNGEFNNNNFINTSVTNSNADFVGLIGRIGAGASVNNILLRNTNVYTAYKNSTTDGFGGFAGSVLGTSSKIIDIKNVTASGVNIDSYGGKNTNVGGLFGTATYANLQNITMTGEDNSDADIVRSDIPYYLEQVEYVESTDGLNRANKQGATIDTGIIPVGNATSGLYTRLELDVTPLRAGVDYPAIAGVRRGTDRFSLWAGKNTNKFHYSYGKTGTTDGNFPIGTSVFYYGSRYNVVMDGSWGIEITDHTTDAQVARLESVLNYTNANANDSIVLLGLRDGDAIYASWQRLYSARIYEGEVLKRDYVPVKVSETHDMKVSYNKVIEEKTVEAGTVGLYDAHNDVLYVTCNQAYSTAYYDAPLMAGPSVKTTVSHIKGNSWVGGVVGKVTDTEINGVSLSYVDVSAVGNISGGLLASGNSSLNTDDSKPSHPSKLINVNKVDNVYMSSISTNTGGIIGYTDASNATYNIEILDMFNTASSTNESEDAEPSNPNNAQLTNISVNALSYCGGIAGQIGYQIFKADDLTVDNIKVIALQTDVGGLIGYKWNMPFTLTFNDCTFKNIRVENGNSSNSMIGNYWGGLIGDDQYSLGTTFNNCDFDNFYVRGDDRVGGIEGRCYDSTSTKAFTTNNCHFTNFKVLGLKTGRTDDYGYAGGLIGLARAIDVYLDNGTTIDNFEVVGARGDGGVIGIFYRDSDKMYYLGAHDTVIDADGNEVENPRVEINNIKVTGLGWGAGGFFGVCTNDSPTRNVCIQNVNINNVEVYAPERRSSAGGLAAEATYVRNCNVGKPEDTLCYDEATGEIVHDATKRGASDTPSVLIKVNDNANVGLVVGALGTNRGTSYMTENVHVYDGQIIMNATTTGDDEGFRVGGIAGYMGAGHIKNSSVNNSTIEGYTGVGGIIGMVVDRNNVSVYDSEVNDCIIAGIFNPITTTVRAERSGFVGGIIGFNQATPSIISGSKVNNSLIVGDNYVGGIAGYMYSRPDDAYLPPAVHDSGTVDTVVIGVGDYIGGTVGAFRASNSQLYNCYVTHGDVTTSESYSPHINEDIDKLHYNDDTKNALKAVYTSLPQNVVKNADGSYAYSSYVLAMPRKTGANNTNNLVGGIVGSFSGSSIHDCYVDSSALISSINKQDGTYTTTGGIAGYMFNNTSSGAIIDNYDVLEYVETNGSQVVDTGYKASGRITVRSKFNNLVATGSIIIGNHVSESDTFRFFNASQIAYLDYGSGTAGNKWRINGSNIYANRIYEIEFGNRYVKDLTTGHLLISNNYVDFGDKNYTIQIGGKVNGTSAQYSSSNRFYYVQIFDMEKLVRDMIPVRRRSDGKVGFYDKVEGKFYPSNTSSDLIASPNLTGAVIDESYDLVPYLHSDSTKKAYINTRVNNASTIRMVGKLSFDNVSTTNYFAGSVESGKNNHIGIYQSKLFYRFNGAEAVPVANTPVVNNTDYEYEMGQYFVKLGPYEYNISGVSYAQSGNMMELFGSYGKSGGGEGFNGKIYYTKMYDGDQLIRDFVPVRRRSDGELGMYDLVNHKFYDDVNTDPAVHFDTDNTALNDTQLTVVKPDVLTNCIVNGTVASFANAGVTVDPTKEATGGFVGYVSTDTKGYIPKTINDYYSFPVGDDYNLTQGPDPLSYSNLMFGGSVIGTTNADIGFGIAKVTRASDGLYANTKAGGTYASDWTLEQQTTGMSSSKYIHYNTAMSTDGYTDPTYLDELVKVETLYRSATADALKYSASKDELSTAHDIADDNTDIDMREAGIGRLRVTPGASITIGSSASTVVDKYSLTENYTGTTTDADTNHIEALIVDSPSDTFYYGAANKGNMNLNYEYWSQFLGGDRPSSTPRLFAMAPRRQANADVDALIENVKVYASGIDTINIEVKDIPTSEFNYLITSRDSSLSGVWPAGQKVITIKYDYSSDITVQFSNSTGLSEKLIECDTFSNTIMTYNNTYCYLHNGQVINENGSATASGTNYIHMYGGKLLDESGNIYDAASGTKTGSVSGLANTNTRALWSGIINSNGDSYTVNTYSRYSLSDGVEVAGRIYVKNSTLVTLSASQDIIGGPIADTYGSNIYATVLLEDGTLSDLGAPLNYPSGFKKYDIKEITSTIDYTGRVVIVRYDDDTLAAFNYITGEEVPVQSSQPTAVQSFANFFRDSIRNFSLHTNAPSKAENSLNDANIYQQNINENPDYANALDNVNKNLEQAQTEDIETKDNPIADIPDEYIGEKVDEEVAGEKIDGDIALPDGSEPEVIDVTEETKEDDTTGAMKEYSIDNGYVVLYNDKEDKTELFKVSEVLSKPTEERVSEEEKAKTLESLGIKTLVPAREETPQNTVSGIALVAAIILALCSLIGILFIIRKKHFSYEK